MRKRLPRFNELSRCRDCVLDRELIRDDSVVLEKSPLQSQLLLYKCTTDSLESCLEVTRRSPKSVNNPFLQQQDSRLQSIPPHVHYHILWGRQPSVSLTKKGHFEHSTRFYHLTTQKELLTVWDPNFATKRRPSCVWQRLWDWHHRSKTKSSRNILHVCLLTQKEDNHHHSF